MLLFDKYVEASGQLINKEKSHFYSSSISPGRISIISDLISFTHGVLPFTYLGVPLFQGKSKKVHLQPIADRIMLKLFSWKVKLLSFMGRVLLIKFVVHSILTHSFHVY